jgi:excisionase family DNA binding protein
MTKQESTILTRLDSIETLLKVQKTQPFTFGEAADYLRLSKSYLYKLTSKGQIGHYKPQGKLIYFEKSELDRWILRNRICTDTELEEIAVDKVQAKGRVQTRNHIGKGGRQ